MAKLWGVHRPRAKKNSTFDELLAATENEKSSFVEMLYRIFNDPIETMDIWSLEGEDIMKSHSEAFQRLKATIAFAEAHSNGGIGAECDYIAVQDASSNLYQHTSLILRDREMARMVNVIPNDRPFDVYTRIAENRRRPIDENKGTRYPRIDENQEACQRKSAGASCKQSPPEATPNHES